MTDGGHETFEGGTEQPSPSVARSTPPSHADSAESGAGAEAEEPDHGQATLAADDPQSGCEELPEPSVAPARYGGRRPRVIVLGTLAVLCLLYVLDLSVSSGTAPRGTTVAGVDVAGLSPRQTEERLRAQLAPRLSTPTVARLDEATIRLDPQTLGIQVDWTATVERAVRQPWSPWTRLRSVFSTREVAPVTTADRARIAAALEQARPVVDRAVVEGGVRIVDGTVQVIQPRVGRRVDVDTSTARIIADGVSGRPVELASVEIPAQVTVQGLNDVVRAVAEPASSGPTELRGAGATVLLSVSDTGKVLRFAPDGHGGMTSDVDVGALATLAAPLLAPTESPARDAGVRFVGERPEVTPSQDGRAVDYERMAADLLETLQQLPPAAAGPSVGVVLRDVVVPYRSLPPRVQTNEIASVSTASVIGEFRTTGFKPDSGQNIRRVAEQVDGALVLPGEVFSLNSHTGPRDATQGYVEAGVIEDGRPARAVGGGISQFATTLYNAAYFAGMDDVEHKEHSYYIDRYPPAREATVFEGVIDLRFGNTTDEPVVIHTNWTPSSITVVLFGQRRFEVTSTTGPRTDATPFGRETVPSGSPCLESDGVDGFAITDTRTVRDLRTGTVRTERRTVRYNPEPEIRCD